MELATITPRAPPAALLTTPGPPALPTRAPALSRGQVQPARWGRQQRSQRFVASAAGDDGDHEAKLPEGDWRSFRAKLVAGEHSTSMQDSAGQEMIDVTSPRETLGGSDERHWAHLISQPEVGCLLVTRQEEMGFFDRTIILLTQHDDREGSYGLVLNRPSPMLVRDVGLDPYCRQAFDTNPLYLGGPVQLEILHVLHGVYECVDESAEILKGVYQSTVESAALAVLDGKTRSSDFQLIAGYSGWGPFQLAGEVHDKSWFVVSASPDVILSCVGQTDVANEWEFRTGAWQNVLQLAGLNSNDTLQDI